MVVWFKNKQTKTTKWLNQDGLQEGDKAVAAGGGSRPLQPGFEKWY